MGGIGDTDNNKNLLGENKTLQRKSLLEGTTAYKLGERVGNTKASAEYSSEVMNRHDRNNKGKPEKQYYDKYKHSFISCKEAQKGVVEAGTIGILGIGKEIKDNITGNNDLKENWEDMKANGYGIYKGFTNRGGDCDEMVQNKYQKYIKQKAIK